jgi:glucose-6-phosphate isomerase
MRPTNDQLWARFQELYFEFNDCGLSLDLSRLGFDDEYLARMAVPMKQAFAAMADLERGAISNPDEKRKVGHYWLRNADLAPEPGFQQAIRATLEDIVAFAAGVHAGTVQGQGGKFEHVLVVGIGGSALGPQLVADALGQPGRDRMKVHFFDNTDPDGMDRTLLPLLPSLGRTLVLVISKSGTTPETRNGMMETAAAYRNAGLDFARHAVAVTQLDLGSKLFEQADREKWLKLFPMWDWVGGRTSVTSAVGLLPAALQGLDVRAFLDGARDCDVLTRNDAVKTNPAALLALSWYHAGSGRGAKDMVVLPYKDRLALFPKYLQQLIMESLGKELDLEGRVVNQGLAVYGNKGSTDQHAYVQQLREGLNNFFVTFVEVLRDRSGASIEVDAARYPGATAGDFLNGFLLGTRTALFDKGRESITLTLTEVSPRTLGVLIALFERTVGLYASLIRINAYHQPGVEGGKKAADQVLKTKVAIVHHLRANAGKEFSADDLGSALKADAETIFKICEHLAANPESGVRKTPAARPNLVRYRLGAG